MQENVRIVSARVAPTAGAIQWHEFPASHWAAGMDQRADAWIDAGVSCYGVITGGALAASLPGLADTVGYASLTTAPTEI